MSIVKKIFSNPNFKYTVVIGFGTFLGSFFSYVLQFILGRFLTVADYGSFTALLSLSNLLGIPATVFAISIVKRVAEYTSRDDKAMTTRMFKSLSIFSLILGVVIFFVMKLFSANISLRLNINNINVVTVFAISLSLSFLSTIPMSFLQGSLRYRRWSFYSALSSFLRTLAAATPAILGLGLFAVFSGLSIAAIVSYLISILLLWRIFSKEKSGSVLPEYKKIFFFGLSTLLMSAALSFMNNIDMVLVKRYFNPEDAGYFAGAVTVGKILLFGCIAVSTLMFPSISALYAQRKSVVSQFKQLILIQTLLVVVGFVIYQIFPVLITTLFFGKSFIHSVPYLRLYTVFIALYVFIYFLVMFFLAIEKTKIYLLLIPGVVIQYVLITIWHTSINQIIQADIISAAATLLLLSLYLIFVIRKSKSN